MRSVRSKDRLEFWLTAGLLTIISAALYLPFIHRLGYYNDDWYLMYAAGAKGATVFKDIFSVDRPLRALVMIPAYSLFGANPLYYNLSAIFFRLMSALAFHWFVRMLWPAQRWAALCMAVLFLAYPGFLSQLNGIDYQSQMVSLAAGMLSLALTIRAMQITGFWSKTALILSSVLLAWFYLGLVEYFIGLELVRLTCILLLALREKESWIQRAGNFFQKGLLWLAAILPFLIWRLYIFESERGATDVDVQFSLADVLDSPMTYLFRWSSTLWDDFLDVLIRAWGTPLRRMGDAISEREWIPGIALAVLILAAIWAAYRFFQNSEKSVPGNGSGWKLEASWVGLGIILCGLLPIILVGRTVDFRSYSRYTLVACAGAAMLWPAALSFISSVSIRNVVLAFLVLSASLTHYANELAHVRDTEMLRNFWWQVSWRIPQMDIGTTLVAHYFVVAEEDYFIWGPANLIYYPDSIHSRYVQPGIYAALLNDETISKIISRQPQEFSNRRSIRTYPNYRNILIITQPGLSSCVQVMDGSQVELSAHSTAQVGSIAQFSEAHRIWLEAPFRTPPDIPFGPEPQHGWCYYYEKASFFRQTGAWETVADLGDEALRQGLLAVDSMEWMPFLQAYAHFDNTLRIEQIAPFVSADPSTAAQACRILTSMSLELQTQELVEGLFCG